MIAVDTRRMFFDPIGAIRRCLSITGVVKGVLMDAEDQLSISDSEGVGSKYPEVSRLSKTPCLQGYAYLPHCRLRVVVQLERMVGHAITLQLRDNQAVSLTALSRT